MDASPGRTRDHRIAQEQAALRRVAVLVAGGPPPEEVFSAVAEEAGRLLEVDFATLTARQRAWADSMSLNAIARPAAREPSHLRGPGSLQGLR